MDDVSRLTNAIDSGKNDNKASSDSEDEPPPLPPPRSFIEKPLPVLPDDSSSDSETEEETGSCDSDTDDSAETNTRDSSIGEEVASFTAEVKLNEAILAKYVFHLCNGLYLDNLFFILMYTVFIISVPESRKRKHSDSQEKSNRISEKVQEMKKKQVDAEKWKKIRSIFINLSSGISFVAVFGAALAYIWYRRTA